MLKGMVWLVSIYVLCGHPGVYAFHCSTGLRIGHVIFGEWENGKPSSKTPTLGKKILCMSIDRRPLKLFWSIDTSNFGNRMKVGRAIACLCIHGIVDVWKCHNAVNCNHMAILCNISILGLDMNVFNIHCIQNTAMYDCVTAFCPLFCAREVVLNTQRHDDICVYNLVFWRVVRYWIPQIPWFWVRFWVLSQHANHPWISTDMRPERSWSQSDSWSQAANMLWGPGFNGVIHSQRTAYRTHWHCLLCSAVWP